MKKLLGIVVLGLLFCNTAFANILLNRCSVFYPAGTHIPAVKTILEKDSVMELAEDSRNEYFISYEDGFVYYTFVESDNSNTDVFNKVGVKSGTINIRYVITFADDKLITAKGRTRPPANNPDLYTTMGLKINLKNGEVFIKHGYESYDGKVFLELWRDHHYDNTDRFRCEFAKTEQDSQGSSGTAFFINNRGNLLTNNHVVEGCKSQKINYYNKEYEAKIIATDKTLDLALLKANIRPKSHISFSKDEPKKRQTITAAGYPLGQFLSDDLKINDGRISALKGFENNSNEIQHDIAINPGNSGGPIVNEKGQLVAIAVSGMAKDITEGLNFGIKASAAANFLKSNKISPSVGYMSFSTSGDKLVKLLEESTVYTFCE